MKKCVYIIFNEELKRTKIGFSSNPEERLKNLMNQSGCRMRLIYNSHKISDFVAVEKDMHRLFADKRGIGEWFYMDWKKPKERMRVMVAGQCKIEYWYVNRNQSIIDISYKIGVSRKGISHYLKSKGHRIKSNQL